jgi:hypothetical protein
LPFGDVSLGETILGDLILGEMIQVKSFLGEIKIR